ncbi:MAG: GDSL-type esterase/lipase family protein [Sandaracinaceae bacterium]
MLRSPVLLVALALGALLPGFLALAQPPALGRSSLPPSATRAAEPRRSQDPPADGVDEAADGVDEAAVRAAAPEAAGEGADGPAEEEGEDAFGVEVALEDPSGEALRAFHEALRRAEAGEGQARILVYGASHVAADYFVDVIRDGLRARFGDGGHGFVLPARPWRSYRHLDVRVESNRRRWTAHRIRANDRDVQVLGLAGVAVETSSGRAWGRVDLGDDRAGRFEVQYLQRPDGGSFDVLLDGRRVRRIRTAADEEAPATAVVTAPDESHVLEVRARGDGPITLFGVLAERERPGVIVDTMGINGARARAHLLWDRDVHTSYLRRRDPHLVALAYGTNESGDTDVPIEDYEAELRRVLERLEATVPRASCLLIGPSDRPMRDEDGELVDRPRTAAVAEVQRRVAADHGCAFFDLVAFGGGPLSMIRWAEADPPFAQQDHIHFTVRGYRRLGEVLLSALLEGIDAVPLYVPED